MVLKFKAKNKNTGASTFSPNGVSAKPIVSTVFGALAANSILTNGFCSVCYSSTIDSWILTYSLGAGVSWGSISGTPTTRDGYGLTDVPTKTELDTALIKKADKATTLAGYGVNFADQSEAEGGTDPHKPMNALGVFQAITKYLTQATETACGLMKVATAEEVNAGRDDTMAITPKKLRLGIQLQLSKAGYVIFPTWLGGIIIQWDGGLTMEGGTTNTTYFPIPFPDAAFAVVVGGFNNAAQLGAYSVYLSDGASGAGGALEKFAFKTRNTGLTGAAGLSYIAIGK